MVLFYAGTKLHGYYILRTSISRIEVWSWKLKFLQIYKIRYEFIKGQISADVLLKIVCLVTFEYLAFLVWNTFDGINLCQDAVMRP